MRSLVRLSGAAAVACHDLAMNRVQMSPARSCWVAPSVLRPGGSVCRADRLPAASNRRSSLFRVVSPAEAPERIGHRTAVHAALVPTKRAPPAKIVRARLRSERRPVLAASRRRWCSRRVRAWWHRRSGKPTMLQSGRPRTQRRMKPAYPASAPVGSATQRLLEGRLVHLRATRNVATLRLGVELRLARRAANAIRCRLLRDIFGLA